MSLKLPDKFEADCSNCDALCCVALSRKEESGYPSHCESGEACPNLDKACLGTGCRIHAVLDQMGWEACQKFDCHGSGQMVTQYFDRFGVRWNEADSPDKQGVFEMFKFMRYVCEIINKFPNKDFVEVLKPDIEKGLERVARYQIMHPTANHEMLFGRFIDEVPDAILLFVPTERRRVG